MKHNFFDAENHTAQRVCFNTLRNEFGSEELSNQEKGRYKLDRSAIQRRCESYADDLRNRKHKQREVITDFENSRREAFFRESKERRWNFF